VLILLFIFEFIEEVMKKPLDEVEITHLPCDFYEFINSVKTELKHESYVLIGLLDQFRGLDNCRVLNELPI